MTRQLLFVILIILGGRTTLKGQTLQALDAQNNLLTAGQPNNFTGVVRTFNNSYKGVKGSPYLNDAWYPGVIILSDGDSLANVGLNYDSYYDELSYVKRDGDSPLFLPQQQVRAFYIKPDDIQSIQYFEKRNLVYGKKDFSGFVQILAQRPDFEIIRKYKTVFLQNQASGAYKTQLYDQFAHISHYFIVKNGVLTPLPQTHGRLAKALGMSKKVMWDAVYANKWDLKTHEDFMQAIKLFVRMYDEKSGG
jgi:hypothetical protein